MSKPKINTDEMLKDIQKAFDLIDKIDNGNIDLNIRSGILSNIALPRDRRSIYPSISEHDTSLNTLKFISLSCGGKKSAKLMCSCSGT